MDRFSRRRRNDEEAPTPLPLHAGPVSNGEFVPAAASAHDRDVNRIIRASIDTAAQRLGMDRRRFLQGAGAVAATLAAFELAGCSSPGTTVRSLKGARRGGTFTT